MAKWISKGTGKWEPVNDAAIAAKAKQQIQDIGLKVIKDLTPPVVEAPKQSRKISYKKEQSNG